MFQGSAISIPSGDHFREKLVEVKYHCMQWVDKAKKVQDIVHQSSITFDISLWFNTWCAFEQVSVDSGELELDKVYDLIMEGNDLLVDVGKELKVTNRKKCSNELVPFFK